VLLLVTAGFYFSNKSPQCSEKVINNCITFWKQNYWLNMAEARSAVSQPKVGRLEEGRNTQADVLHAIRASVVRRFFRVRYNLLNDFLKCYQSCWRLPLFCLLVHELWGNFVHEFTRKYLCSQYWLLAVLSWSWIWKR